MARAGSASWTLKAVTFLVWAVAASSAVYWGFKLASGGTSTPVVPVTRTAAPPDQAGIARMLGQSAAVVESAAPTPPPSLASRFQLLGVVADRSETGAALLSVDGRPPKPYRVGSTVDDGLVLQSVQGRRAVLAETADGPPVLTLELPPPPR